MAKEKKANPELKKAPEVLLPLKSKKLTPNERITFHEEQVKKARQELQEEEAAKEKKALDKESKELLRQVIEDWPFVPIEAKRCFAADVHEATAK